MAEVSVDAKYKSRSWLIEQYEHGLSQTQIAKICKVGSHAISDWTRRLQIDWGVIRSGHRLQIARQIARDNGGDLLSDKYEGVTKKLIFECALGHRWEATYDGVVNSGTWCPTCARASKITIDDAKDIAKSRGGECLSELYIGSKSKLAWQCSEGHTWNASYDCVANSGTWCPHCAKVAKLTLEDARATAISRGGYCLSDSYESCITSMLWECEHGHRWVTSYSNIRQGSWCHTCARNETRKKLVGHTIEEAMNIASENGGKCLSDAYINTESHLLWECSEGHRWEASFHSVNTHNSWCPVCAKNNNVHENLFRKAMGNVTGVEFPTSTPDWLRNEQGYQLEIDGFNEELMIGFEYQGRQHFEFVEFFHTDTDGLEKRKSNDAIKKRILANRGVTMLYPDYKLSISEYESFIHSNLR